MRPSAPFHPRAAFPPSCFPCEAEPIAFFPGRHSELVINTFTAVVENTQIFIPQRIYDDTMNSFGALPRKLMLCLFTRHHNGHVRERSLRALSTEFPMELFMIPYILKLAEEYVIELTNYVEGMLPSVPNHLLLRFLQENAAWLPLMRSRCASYWDCYHRSRYPSFKEYPGAKIYARLKAIPLRQA